MTASDAVPFREHLTVEERMLIKAAEDLAEKYDLRADERKRLNYTETEEYAETSGVEDARAVLRACAELLCGIVR